MEFVENLTEKEYEKFVSSAPKTHFMQSYAFGNIRKLKGFIPHYVGLREGKKLVCCALLLEKKLIFNYSYYYVPRGYVIDYSNFSLLEEFTLHLKKFAKKNKAIFVKIDPDIKRWNLNSDGEVIGDFNNNELISHLKKLGYHHNGFNTGFEMEQPRFTFRLDLDRKMEDIFKNFHPTTRKILNKGNKYQLEVYKGGIEDIEDFYETMKETAKREGILQAPLSYYKTFYQEFAKDGHGDLYVAKVDVDKLKEIMKNNIDELEKELDSLDDEKYKNVEKNANKKQEINNQLSKLKKDYEGVLEITLKEVVLSSIITVKYKDMVWTVHGGNHSILMNLNANYLLYYTIIEDAVKDGYKVIDFFGTCGEANPSSDNPIFGIHSFKKRLGGEYTEFIGEFDLVVNPVMYFLFTKLIPVYRKIIRKIKQGRRS